MLTKSKEISKCQLLLKIEPSRKEISNYLRIFVVVIFVVFSVVMSQIMSVVKRQPQEIYMDVLLYCLLCVLAWFFFLRLKPRPLLMTEKGITDGLFISVLWEELEFYKFVSLPDIGPNKNRRTLRLISNKPPFYSLRFIGLPRELYDRGIFFTETEVVKAEEIFSAKGISKE